MKKGVCSLLFLLILCFSSSLCFASSDGLDLGSTNMMIPSEVQEAFLSDYPKSTIEDFGWQQIEEGHFVYILESRKKNYFYDESGTLLKVESQ